jgi:HD-GYP domain-containing protein (c-di-GMP phosphodiesterase class II)
MAQVPEIAAAHHEKLDGSGYPLGLQGEQIHLASRIMAVADIFEALSARDRPYKKPMPLSQAMNILSLMAKDHHLDQNIVTLFLQSDLLYGYARKYLCDNQLDVEFPSKNRNSE